MKTKKMISVIVSIVLTVLVFGQAAGQERSANFVTVSGKVVDSNSDRPVAFANVYVPGTHVGTVANLDGNFTLKISKNLNADKIAISHLGYKVTEFEVEQRIGKYTQFPLKPHSITLQEVLVKPHDPREIVLKALDYKEKNYTTSPHLLTGFYRETIKQRNDYISIAEAVIKIYQAPVTSPIRHNQVKVVQGRKSADVEDADTLILKLQAGPKMANIMDFVRNEEIIVDRETIDWYEYELLDVVSIEGRSNFVIGFTPRVTLPFALNIGKFYICTESYAFTMADFSVDLSDRNKAAKHFIKRKPLRLRFTPRNTRYLITYTNVDDTYHLNYIRSEMEFFADWRRRLFRTNYNVMVEMAVTQRESENVSRFSRQEAFSSRSILADDVSVYFEEDFWGDYNYIEPDQSIESAIRKLNRTLESMQNKNK